MEHEVLDTVDGARTITMSGIDAKDASAKSPEKSADEMLIDAQVSANNSTADSAMNEDDGPPLTHALEALLGGLEPEMPTPAEKASASDATAIPDVKAEESNGQEAIEEPKQEDVKMGEAEVPELPMDTTTTENSAPESTIPTEVPVVHVPAERHLVKDESRQEDVKMEEVETQSFPAEVSAAEGSAPDITVSPEVPAVQSAPLATENTDSLPPSTEMVPTEGGEDEHPEWEVDSSPIESSSDDSSDSSSDESDDGENEVAMSLEEQAKILMGEEAGSDDEGDKTKGAGGQLRTKNEVAEVVIPKPDITITPDMPIKVLGAVEQTVDNILLIKAYTSGEYQVLESGSVLCLEDRTVFGAVAETIGRVQQPFYSVMFTNTTELQAANVPVGTKVFYTDKFCTYVFTQALKAYKGSDASNLHDEEVGDEEMEFSDDEAEAEHKRRLKQSKRGGRGAKQQNGRGRGGGHPLQQMVPYDAAQGISYDDAEEDGPYKPLARPTGYADTVGRTEAPEEGFNSNERPSSSRGNHRGRGDRGRGDRGRGRGDRGRGRGGHQDNRKDGYSLPPRPTQTFPQQPQNFTPQPQNAAAAYPQMAAAFPNFFMPQNMPSFNPQQSNPQQPQLGWPQFQQYQQAFQNMQNMQNWPAPPPPVPAQNGGYVNPAIFPNGLPPNGQAGSPQAQWQQQNGHQYQDPNRGRGRGS